MRKFYITLTLALAFATTIFANEPININFISNNIATTKSRNVETEIRTQPEGVVYENMSRSCMSYGNILDQPHLFTVDAALSKIVEGNDGCLYVYNPIWSFSTQTWMKLEKGDGNNYVLRTPHMIYTENEDGVETKYYLRRLLQKTMDDGSISLGIDKTTTDINFTWENGILTMEKDCLIGVINDKNQWNMSADYDLVIETVTDELITFDVSEAKSHFMSYYDIYGMPQAAVVYVKNDGGTIYIGHLPDAAENAYIKGSIKDGKAIFPSKQYVGASTTKDYNMYFFGANVEEVWDDELEDFVEVATMADSFEFMYDAESGVLSSGDVFMINPGKRFTSEQTSIFSEPAMEAWEEVPAIPADPEIIDHLRATEESYNWGWISANIPITDVNGIIMNPNKLFYTIYLDDEVYTLTADNYPTFTEPSTEIPYLHDSYADGIFAVGQEHSFMFQFDNYDRMGVQSIYYGGDEVHKSNIVYTISASVESLDAEKTIENVVYTDLIGRRIVNPEKGIYIKTTIYSDGSFKTSKVSIR